MRKEVKDYEGGKSGMMLSFWIGLFLAIMIVAFVFRLVYLESQIKILE